MYNTYDKEKYLKWGIRWATLDDAYLIAKEGIKFYKESGVEDIVDYDEQSVELTMRALIPNPDAIMLLLSVNDEVVGGAGAMLFPLYFNFSHKTGQEMFYWIDPGHRGKGLKLLEALEFYAKQGGAQSFSMISLEKLKSESVDKLYKRRGYKVREHTYVKEL